MSIHNSDITINPYKRRLVQITQDHSDDDEIFVQSNLVKRQRTEAEVIERSLLFKSTTM